MKTKTLKTKDEFKVGAHGVGWLDSDFHPRFPEPAFEPRKLGTFQKLGKSMTGYEIEKELKPGLCELGDVLAFLENPPEECKDGWGNLFFIKGADDETFVARVDWDSSDSSWRVDAWRRDGSWDSGRRIFSPATHSETPALNTIPSDSLSLETSPQNQEIEIVEQIITKIKYRGRMYILETDGTHS